MSDFEIKLRDFESQILFFNGMYKLPVAKFPSSGVQAAHEAARIKTSSNKEAVLSRLMNFKKILGDECDEINDIINSIETGHRYKDGKVVQPEEQYTEIDFLVDFADLMGDIQVFCASEMVRYGIPIKETLSIIMSSNFSKLGPNGEPIYDSTGKVQKGPGYWKPEPRIKAMLEEKIEETRTPIPTGIIWREGEEKK